MCNSCPKRLIFPMYKEPLQINKKYNNPVGKEKQAKDKNI